MIRVLSHRWHSAGEESDRYSVRSSRAARATACAAQAQERERRCVSTPSRHSRGGERHAREGDLLLMFADILLMRRDCAFWRAS